MQNQLKPGKLLDSKGNLTECGYAYDLVKYYIRSDIKANKWRIKEWDYYYIGNNDYGVAVTVADNSYMWLCTATFLNFKEKWEHTASKMGAFSFGKLHLPETSKTGDIKFAKKGFSFEFKNDYGKRHLIVKYNKLYKNMDFYLDCYLEQPIKDTMVIATPWLNNEKQHFYYNQKINCLAAKGFVKFNNIEYSLDNAYGVLDWGRGVWTYKNTWYWSSMSGKTIDDKYIGFNLGYGFGDQNASKATENMFFYEDKAWKLEDVTFNIPLDEKGNCKFLEPWTFTSSDDSINMTFNPIIDRNTNTNVLIIQTLQHQVFGIFNGYIKINNQTIEIKDMIGFAEKVYMKY